METANPRAWRTSLHGGHSVEFCDHAHDTLRDLIDAAVRFGYDTFGVTEHVPRVEERFLYSDERKRGWSVEKIVADFERYTSAVTALAEEYADRITVLRGFECEVVPADRYASLMRQTRERLLDDGCPAFDYCVGSVHYVDEMQIDGSRELFETATRAFGGLEPFVVRYYELVGEMCRAIRPDVVGHLDLVRKYARAAGYDESTLSTGRAKDAALGALEVIREQGCILDLNTAGWRKGLDTPYPAPWLVRAAGDMGIGLCFGDDSHCIADVGFGIVDAAAYLRENGVKSVTTLTREGSVRGGHAVKRLASLPE